MSRRKKRANPTARYLANQHRNKKSLLYNIAPNRQQFNKLSSKDKAAWTRTLKKWKSKSPMDQAIAYDKMLKMAAKIPNRSRRQMNATKYNYMNAKRISQQINEEGLSLGTTRAGQAYEKRNRKGEITNMDEVAKLRRYLAVKHVGRRAVEMTPREVGDALENISYYKPEQKTSVWVITNKSITAKNGSSRGSSIGILDGGRTAAEVRAYCLRYYGKSEPRADDDLAGW